MKMASVTTKKVFEHLVERTEDGQLTWTRVEGPYGHMFTRLDDSWKALITIDNQETTVDHYAVIALTNTARRSKSLYGYIEARLAPDLYEQIRDFYGCSEQPGYETSGQLLRDALPGLPRESGAFKIF